MHIASVFETMVLLAVMAQTCLYDVRNSGLKKSKDLSVLYDWGAGPVPVVECTKTLFISKRPSFAASNKFHIHQVAPELEVMESRLTLVRMEHKT